jgi:hypothetical protein
MDPTKISTLVAPVVVVDSSQHKWAATGDTRARKVGLCSTCHALGRCERHQGGTCIGALDKILPQKPSPGSWPIVVLAKNGYML